MIARTFRLTLLLLSVLSLSALPALAGHGDAKPPRQGVLLVAFGTSAPEARVAYDNLDRLAREAFPGTPIRWAYTSAMIRTKLGAGGELPDSPALALARMANEGFTDIAVQPLHVIPGFEFHDLLRTARALEGKKDGPRRVSVGLPLLSTEDDLARAAELLTAAYPARKGEAVVFVGHGTEHPAGVTYPALQAVLAERSAAHLVGTVEGRTGPEEITARLARQKVRSVTLVPLMAVAGDHAQNDIAGGEPDSWASIMTAAGLKVTPVLAGLASSDAVAGIWIEHLRQAVAGLAEDHAH